MNQLYYELLGTTNIGTAAAPIYPDPGRQRPD